MQKLQKLPGKKGETIPWKKLQKKKEKNLVKSQHHRKFYTKSEKCSGECSTSPRSRWRRRIARHLWRSGVRIPYNLWFTLYLERLNSSQIVSEKLVIAYVFPQMPELDLWYEFCFRKSRPFWNAGRILYLMFVLLSCLSIFDDCFSSYWIDKCYNVRCNKVPFLILNYM